MGRKRKSVRRESTNMNIGHETNSKEDLNIEGGDKSATHTHETDLCTEDLRTVPNGDGTIRGQLR